MGVSGGNELRKLINRLVFVRAPAFRAGLSRNLAQEAQTQIVLGFRAQRDPYGLPWPPSKRATAQGGMTLIDSARLRNSWNARGAIGRADAQGFVIGTNVKYARIHQKGGVIHTRGRGGAARKITMPQRMMVPENSLGPIWEAALRNAAVAYFRKTA
jgi:phage gpG-like protein